MNWTTTHLATLHEEIWRRLAVAPAASADTFRLPGLATVRSGFPANRVVVLRRVNETLRELDFHTDIRSPKVEDLRACPCVVWLFHDPAARVQIRAAARATIHFQDEASAAAWPGVPPASALAYASPLAPGDRRERADSPAESSAATEPAAGRANFAVVRTTVERLDWLWLREGGHFRAVFEWVDERWTGHWLTP